jgi:hypothetical protein
MKRTLVLAQVSFFCTHLFIGTSSSVIMDSPQIPTIDLTPGHHHQEHSPIAMHLSRNIPKRDAALGRSLKVRELLVRNVTLATKRFSKKDIGTDSTRLGTD